MFLIIDIGNTNQKAAVFSAADEMVDFIQMNILDKILIDNILKKYDIQSAMVSSVAGDAGGLVQWLSARVPVRTFSADLSLPIQIAYQSPCTLGTDRLAAAVGANALFPHRNVLTVQLGTCLVFDFVNAENQYVGGSIAPGMRMRFHALHQHTARLPLVEPQPLAELVARTTESSILSGVMNGMAAEIEGVASRYETHFPNLQVVMTGGDLPRFQHLIKNSIFAAPNLVLWGMYKTLRLNVSESE